MIVTLTQPLPTTGDLIQASDVSSPITDILAVLNGGIDDTNLAANSVGTSELVDGSVTEAKLSASYFLGWNTSGLVAPTTITYNGYRSYTIVFNGQDYTQELSDGMKLRFTRTVVAPTQSTSLNGSTQFWNRAAPTGMTFTDDFTVSAWIKLSSLPTGAEGEIISRFNGTSGWDFKISQAGKVKLTGRNAGGGNYSEVVSAASVPIGKWVHVAAQLDMSAFTASPTTSYTMIDGLDTVATVARAGTNPTALVQAGNLEIGSENGGLLPFPGRIAQVAVYNTKIAQATIRGTMGQALTGSETGLISGYSFNGAATDLNATNANNLTAQGSASYTTDGPFAQGSDTYETAGTTEYGVVVGKPVFSTNTTVQVYVAQGSMLPTSGGITATSFSTQQSPYGFPQSFSNPYRFRGFSNSNFTLTNGAFGKVPINVEEFDPNNNFDNVTNYRYTVPVSGYYQISGRVSHGNAGNYRVLCAIYLNGQPFVRGSDVTAPFAGSEASTLVYLGAGSYIELFNLTTTAALTADVSGADTCFFSATLVERG